MPTTVAAYARARRTISLALPTLGAATLRSLQLALLIVLSRTTAAGERDAVLSGFGLFAAVGILSDSGAANFLLTRTDDQTSRQVYRLSLLFHFALSATALSAGAAWVFLKYSDNLSPKSQMTLGAVALTQLLDGLIRAGKIPLLTKGRDASYALVDIALALAKLPVLVIAITINDGWLLIFLPCSSVVIFAWTYNRNGMLLISGVNEFGNRLALKILEVGLSGSLSAGYSQMPTFVGIAFLPAVDVAHLTVATRLIQAIEFVPLTLSLQAVPRLRRVGHLPLQWWLAFVTTGGVFSGSFLLLVPITDRVLRLQLSPALLLVALLLALTVKFGNYLLVASLLAFDMARQRVRITITVVVVAVLFCFISVKFGVAALAFGVVGTELLLSSLTLAAIRRRPSVHAGQNGLDVY